MAEEGQLFAPYVDWAVATNFAYLPGDRFRVLLELEGSAASFAEAVDGAGLDDLVQVPTIYQTPSREFRKDHAKFCMAIMSKRALIALVTGEDVEAVTRLAPLKGSLKRIELGTPAEALGRISPKPIELPLASNPPRRAIVAVIDDGLAFAHERFRFADGTTRFKFFWDQDGGTSTQALGWGREFTSSDINNLLASCTHSGIVDEDDVYRRAGQHLVGRRTTHGTHIMDVACGLDPEDVTERSPYLIGVQLPKWVTEETSGALLTALAHAAIAYILSRADQIAAHEGTASLPVVINLSYGTIAGPHDGTGVLEEAIDQWIAGRSAPLRVVFPAGNHYLARCHASFKLDTGSVEKLRWRVQPDDKASSLTEIWLPKLAEGHVRPKLAIRVTTPTGVSSPWVLPGGDWRWPTHNDVRFQARYYDIPGRRPMIRLSMLPTSELTGSLPTAPSGTWLIEVRNDGNEVHVDAWVQRGDTPFGHPLFGRQSRFDDTKYKRFDLAGRPEQEDKGSSPIHRRGTLNALATGRHTIVIGGFRHSDRVPSEYSGAGPVATPRTGPDAVAIADDSVAMDGILAAGTRSGSVVALRGTSVAAPQVTRLVARLMTDQLPNDRAAVQAFATGGDPNAPAPGSASEERLGRGRIDGPEPHPFRWKRW
jgi:subtilase family protein